MLFVKAEIVKGFKLFAVSSLAWPGISDKAIISKTFLLRSQRIGSMPRVLKKNKYTVESASKRELQTEHINPEMKTKAK